jgi:hypothetical protein
MQPVEVDEDLLRHVLRLMRVGEDAVGDADDTGVLGPEKRLERLVVSPSHDHSLGAYVHH